MRLTRLTPFRHDRNRQKVGRFRLTAACPAVLNLKQKRIPMEKNNAEAQVK